MTNVKNEIENHMKVIKLSENLLDILVENTAKFIAENKCETIGIDIISIINLIPVMYLKHNFSKSIELLKEVTDKDNFNKTLNEKINIIKAVINDTLNMVERDFKLPEKGSEDNESK